MAAAAVPSPEGPVFLENMQPVVWIVTIPFATMCLASILIRLYTRRFLAKSFGADDWFMLVVIPVWIGQQYIAWMWTILGGGLHIGVVPDENVARINVEREADHGVFPRLQYLFAEEFYYLFLQFLIKMSFLCFYFRTLTTTTRFQNAVYVVMSLVCCQTVRTWIFYCLQCIPIDAYFHPELYPNRRCVASSLSYYLPSVVNVSMDAIIYIMPVFPLWHLQLFLRCRLGLIAIFTMGGGAVTVSLLRFIVLWQLSNSADATCVFGSVTIVTSIEFAAAVITANMPGTAAFGTFGPGGGVSSRRGGGGHPGSGSRGDVISGGHELETIGAKSSRKKKWSALDSVLETRADENASWARTESEEKLTECPPPPERPFENIHTSRKRTTSVSRLEFIHM
ncbi:hypothetical protein PG994_002375 [Apiospora phragmitis]|uniref:Rhodopsin domain-containing protein n=1 Tax=Apiospora phragmitis TaxID=2905665 RepID=A0ABR1WW60_9PEZI